MNPNPVLIIVRNRFAAERMQRQFNPGDVRVLWPFALTVNCLFRAAFVAPPEEDTDLIKFAEWIDTSVRTRLAPGCQANFQYL